jgi:ketosteroid isomerase-like protein
MTHTDVVGKIYSAFARGDVATMLGELDDDVEWEYGANSTTVPWLQPRRGPAEVPAFFQALGGLTAVHRFEVKELLESGDLVVAMVDIEFTVHATGQRVVEEDEVHVWRFRGDKVVRFRHRADTHLHQRAYDG